MTSDYTIDESLEDEPELEALVQDMGEEAAFPTRLPVFPFLINASGLYTWTQSIFPQPTPLPLPIPLPRPLPIPPVRPGLSSEEDEGVDESYAEELAESGDEAALSPLPFWFRREELRLDVDGRYPQMTASGTLHSGFSVRIHWIARLRPAGRNNWIGRIWYKNGNASYLPQTTVRISVVRSIFANQRRATVRFFGGGPLRVRTYRFSSAYHHRVEFEFDRVSNATAVTQINTCSHPNRPASLPCSNLSINTVFRRAGFNVSQSPNGNTIPISEAGANARWSDAEMHDAMQTYWSRFANRPQWAMWTLFARLHDIGPNLGGIMFDDIGPNHRQGTAMFSHAFIANAPAGDPAPPAWVARMQFWTAVHEMGHAFNLAHSWQKHLGSPWIPLASEPQARSFMNYPYFVSGGQSAFFSDFDYRFSDQELLFMRHAPARFVQMGNADWFDDHGFEQAETEGKSELELRVGVDRHKADFDFLEPIVLDLRLTNTSDSPALVSANALEDAEHMTVIIKKDGKAARQWVPYATYCHQGEKTVLASGHSVSDSLFVSAGRNGWDLAEPGRYTVQLSMEIDGATVVSNPLRLRVAPPKGYDEEYVAQDVFTDNSGRVMAFDGSRVLEDGNDAWREVVERLPNSKAAYHAKVCLAKPQMREYLTLNINAPDEALSIGSDGAIDLAQSQESEGSATLKNALLDDAEAAATTLGVEDYRYYTDQLIAWLKDKADKKEAQQAERIVKNAIGKIQR